MILFSAGKKECSDFWDELTCDIPASIAVWGQTAGLSGESP